MDNELVIEWNGEEITSLDDELSEEELREMEEDARRYGEYEGIPTWSVMYKKDEE